MDEPVLNQGKRQPPERMKLKLSNFFGEQTVPESIEGVWNLPSPDFPDSLVSSESSSPSLDEPILERRRGSLATILKFTKSSPDEDKKTNVSINFNKSLSVSLTDLDADTKLSPSFKTSKKSLSPGSSNFAILRNRPSLPHLNLGSFFKQSKTTSEITVDFMECDELLPLQIPYLPPPELYTNTSREESTAERAFWLLKLIRRSIETGSFLTPRLFVPRQIWSQSRGNVTRMAQKAHHLQWLTGQFEQMDKIDVNSTISARSQLDQLDGVVHRIQSSLPRLSTPGFKTVSSLMKNLLPPKPDFDHGRRGSLPSDTLSPTSSDLHSTPYSIEDYSLTILRFLNSCDTLESWFNHFIWSNRSPPPSIQHGLYRATSFLSHTIISFLVEDIDQLLSTYCTGITQDICE